MARPIEVRSMIDSGLRRWCSTKDLRLPCVQVGVEVDHGYRTVSGVDGSQQRKHDGVVASKSDDTRMMFSVSRDWHEWLSRD